MVIRSKFQVQTSVFKVQRSGFVVMRAPLCVLLLFMITALSSTGCGEQADTETPDHSTPVQFKGTPTAIGNTGLTIDIAEGYAIDSQIDSLFRVYYFKPTAANAAEDEAGIYFGPRPDTNAPNVSYSKKIFDGQFMGNAVKWTEYTTSTYTQREVFIDQGPEKKIHCWCYSHDPATLEKLWAMIKTIR